MPWTVASARCQVLYNAAYRIESNRKERRSQTNQFDFKRSVAQQFCGLVAEDVVRAHVIAAGLLCSEVDLTVYENDSPEETARRRFKVDLIAHWNRTRIDIHVKSNDFPFHHRISWLFQYCPLKERPHNPHLLDHHIFHPDLEVNGTLDDDTRVPDGLNPDALIVFVTCDIRDMRRVSAVMQGWAWLDQLYAYRLFKNPLKGTLTNYKRAVYFEDLQRALPRQCLGSGRVDLARSDLHPQLAAYEADALR